MAEKHRFKKNREFKKRFDDGETDNEEGDIRTFKFHRVSFKDNDNDRRERTKGGRERREGGRKGGKDFGRGKGKDGFKKYNKRFNDEE